MSQPEPPDFPAIDLYARIYDLTMQVEPGFVTTYGTIARMVGCGARQVGYAMHNLSNISRSDVPWQRVVNYKGMIPTHGDHQRRLLEAEGVRFDAADKIDLKRFAWRFAPPNAVPSAEPPPLE